MRTRLCIISGEITNTTKEFFFGGVFFGDGLPKPPLCKGRWLAEQDGEIVKLSKSSAKQSLSHLR